MTPTPRADTVETVRRFSRFYTSHLGLLKEGLLDSPFSLAEARLIFELAHRERAAGVDLAADLELDPGYVSRTLGRLGKRGLSTRIRSPEDGRRVLHSLTEAGLDAFAQLNAASKAQLVALLGGLSVADQRRLVDSLETVERLLGPRADSRAPYLLRPPEPGDLGWVIQRHGAVYTREYGWNEEFEALVAGVIADYARDHDPRRERCWIAEKDGANVGSVFLMRRSEDEAQLRCLLVEPEARGLGIGGRLGQEGIRFAERCGYTSVMLWTTSGLDAARRIYEAAGFRLTEEEPRRLFGFDLVSQTWVLEL